MADCPPVGATDSPDEDCECFEGHCEHTPAIRRTPRKRRRQPAQPQPTDDRVSAVTDAIFGEATMLMFELVDKDAMANEVEARVAAILSASAPRLAKAAVAALDRPGAS